MESSKKYALIGTLCVFLFAAGYIGWFFHQRHVEENAPVAPRQPELHATDDQNVYLKQMHMSSLKDAKEINGKRIWMASADQVMAFEASPSHVNYKKSEGLLRGAEPIDVVNFIEQKADPVVATRIPEGDNQIVMLFHRGGDTSKLLGTPVASHSDGTWNFYLDTMAFYEDPHKLYEHWGPKIWDAVDHHRVIQGMSERAVGLAIGQITTAGGGTLGDRTATFLNEGKPITVTFMNDKATRIEGQQ